MTVYFCESLVVHCMDYRLQKYLNDWLEKNIGTGNYDRAVIAGGVLDVYYVLNHVELAAPLHKIRRVILINHEDCGAYAEAGKLGSHLMEFGAAAETNHAPHVNLSVW